MKILVYGSGKIKYMPYLNFYLDNLDRIKNEVHLLYWNNDLKNEDTSNLKNITLHEFKFYQEDEISKLFKIKGYYKFRKFVKEILKKEKFDIIIVLHSLTGVIIFDKLLKYKNRYIFDYRDSTYENFFIFKFLIGKLVKNSIITFVSSDGFRKFLPQNLEKKIFTSHNLLVDSLNHRKDRENNKIKSDKIRIVFWGFIRNEEINLEIIRKISLDNRFELHYYGREQQTALNLKKYVEINNIKNVFFHGEYNPNERYNFICKTDIIHNIYYDNNMMLAMPNKYYDGIIFKIPQICMKDSFMGKMVTNANVGLTCNPYEKNFLEQIYNYHKNFNYKKFKEFCDIELKRIMNEYNVGVHLQKDIYNFENIKLGGKNVFIKR